MTAKKVNAQYFNDLTQNIEYFIRTNSSKGNPQKFTGFTLGNKFEKCLQPRSITYKKKMAGNFW